MTLREPVFASTAYATTEGLFNILMLVAVSAGPAVTVWYYEKESNTNRRAELRTVLGPVISGRFDGTLRGLRTAGDFPDWVTNPQLCAELSLFFDIEVQAAAISERYDDYLADLGPSHVENIRSILIIVRPLVAGLQSDPGFARRLGVSNARELKKLYQIFRIDF
jgi:hypothetical protein